MPLEQSGACRGPYPTRSIAMPSPPTPTWVPLRCPSLSLGMCGGPRTVSSEPDGSRLSDMKSSNEMGERPAITLTKGGDRQRLVTHVDELIAGERFTYERRRQLEEVRIVRLAELSLRCATSWATGSVPD